MNRQTGLKALPSHKLPVRAVKISGTLLTVVGGSLANFSIKALCINCGFPSKNLPQPATNNVSPEIESLFQCIGSLGFCQKLVSTLHVGIDIPVNTTGASSSVPAI